MTNTQRENQLEQRGPRPRPAERLRRKPAHLRPSVLRLLRLLRLRIGTGVRIRIVPRARAPGLHRQLRHVPNGPAPRNYLPRNYRKDGGLINGGFGAKDFTPGVPVDLALQSLDPKSAPRWCSARRWARSTRRPNPPRTSSSNSAPCASSRMNPPASCCFSRTFAVGSI